MNLSLRLLLGICMVVGLAMGFFHLIPTEHEWLFTRLHIFLFNLVAGCTLVMVVTLRQRGLTRESGIYFAGALAYGLCAFFEFYAASFILALALAGVVEYIRQKNLGLFPWVFFDPRAPVSEKFHHASVLCLSIGLVISAASIVNAQWFMFLDSPKLTLDIFFLGFSFPLSLITFSAMFDNMEDSGNVLDKVLANGAFWALNLGVITFFVFILLENDTGQFVISTVLYCAVLTVLWLHIRLGRRGQPMLLFTSGLCFLLCTALTGLVYIFLLFFGGTGRFPGFEQFMMVMHTFLSLYGWNLSGLAVLYRNGDYPLALSGRRIIMLHWATVAFAAPLAHYAGLLAPVAVAMFAVFLFLILLAPPASAARTMDPAQSPLDLNDPEVQVE